jgi:periplasmic protein TonB
MTIPSPIARDVFTVREIARAAGASIGDAEALLASGRIASVEGGLMAGDEAVRAVLLLRGIQAGPGPEHQLFSAALPSDRRRGFPLTASGLLHVAFGVVLVTAFGLTSQANVTPQASKPARLVFLVTPGPGGGGGGGGLRQPAPARQAMLKAQPKEKSSLKSPVPVERAVRRPVPEPPRPPRPVPEVRPVPQPVEPPPPVAKPDPIPPVVAPVVSAPAEPRDQAGVLTSSTPPAPSQGQGTGGGSGTGAGTGLGEGTGPGIGEGTGGGTGGGPYRPGSGITAPAILQEVKPDYTEDARRRGLSGDVVLEIVVKSDGRVGAVRIVQGLGAGLDERAVAAVRQWRFSPATRHGVPVDVIVEVAMEFKIR